MGRALVIITTGMVFIFGMYQMSINSRHTTSTVINVESASEIQARNFALSGIELAITHLNDSFWETNENYTFDVDGSQVTIEIDEISADSIFIEANATVNARTARVLANVRPGGGGEMPAVKAAITILGDAFHILAKSAAWTIDGRNYNHLTGALAGDGEDQPGIIATPTAYDQILLDIAKRSDQILGVGGGTPNMDSQDADADYVSTISSFMDEAINSSVAVTYGTGNIAETTLGTDASPQITVIDGSATITGGSVGTGIMIVKEGATLDIRGNFEFTGLIIVEGNIIGRGTPEVYGGIIYTDKHDVSFGDDSLTNKGTPKFRYSKSALDLVQATMSSNLGSGFRITGIYH